jgi:hypothetical protein
MHGWAKRQYASDDSKERVRKHRENKKKQASNESVTVTVTPPDTEPDSETETETPLTPQVEPKAEEGKFKFDLGGVVCGALKPNVSVEARRRAAQLLGIADADPLVALYVGWKGSRAAKDVDAHFVSSAPTLLANAPPAVKAACGSVAPAPIEPRAAAKPSRELLASLGGKHAR